MDSEASSIPFTFALTVKTPSTNEDSFVVVPPDAPVLELSVLKIPPEDAHSTASPLTGLLSFR